MTKKILIVSSNPLGTDPLRLDEETREIMEAIKRTRHSDQFDIRTVPAARYKDLRRTLMDFKPDIVHFSGHGDDTGLCLEGEAGYAVPVSSKALADLFNLCFKHNQVECVIINVCNSHKQANVINKYIKYVIGMPGSVRDEASIAFSIGFYDALAAGKSIEEAFQFGKNAVIQTYAAYSETLIPVLKINEKIPARPPITQGQGGIKKKKNPMLALSAAILLITLSIFMYKNFKSSTHQKPEQITELTLPAPLKKDLVQLAQDITDSLESKISQIQEKDWIKYKIPDKKLSLIFLYNRGPDISLSDLQNPMKQKIYESVVNEVETAVSKRPLLTKRLEILNVDFEKCRSLNQTQWLPHDQYQKIGIMKSYNAIYELLLSIDRVSDQISIGGKLVIYGNADTPTPPQECAFLSRRTFSGSGFIQPKKNNSQDIVRNLDFLVNQATPIEATNSFQIRAGMIPEAKNPPDFSQVMNGTNVFNTYPIRFQFPLSKNYQRLIVLAIDSSGNMENVYPGTENAITNGDYLIPNSAESNKAYTKVMRKSIYIDDYSGEISFGDYSPEETGEHRFYFFFLKERNLTIETIVKLADKQISEDIEIDSSKGYLTTVSRFPDADTMDHVYVQRVVLNVIEPINKNK